MSWRWEYLILKPSQKTGIPVYYIDGAIEPKFTHKLLGEVCNILGDDQWEMVGVTSTIHTIERGQLTSFETYVFKRVKK